MLTTDKVQVIYLDPIDLQYYRLSVSLKKELFQFDGKGIIGSVHKAKIQNFSLSTNTDKKYNALVDLESFLPLITHPFVDLNGQVIAIIQVEYNDIYNNSIDKRSHDISPLDHDILELYYGNVKTKLLQLFEEIKNNKDLDDNKN